MNHKRFLMINFSHWDCQAPSQCLDALDAALWALLCHRPEERGMGSLFPLPCTPCSCEKEVTQRLCNSCVWSWVCMVFLVCRFWNMIMIYDIWWIIMKNSVIWSWHLEAAWYRYNGKPCHFIPADHWAFSAVFHTTSTWRLSGEGSCSALAMRMISAFFFTIQNMRALWKTYMNVHMQVYRHAFAHALYAHTCLIMHITYTLH